MLFSHKVCRWLVHLTLPLGLVGLALLAPKYPLAAVALGIAAVVAVLGRLGLRWPAYRRVPLPLAICGYVVGVNLAALLAWGKALRGEQNPIWEPTRRPDAARVPSATS
jgi:hypothetical protein